MSAGYDGPPLTRREARERERALAAERERAAAAGDLDGNPESAPPVVEQSPWAAPVESASKPESERSEPVGEAAHPEPVEEYTLTRRELRELRRREEEEAARRAIVGTSATNGDTEDGVAPVAPVAPVEPQHTAEPMPEAAPAAEAEAEPSVAVVLPEDGRPVRRIRERPTTTWASDERDPGTSGSTSTSNALIVERVPSVPATGPINATGEVIITGTLAVPLNTGANGRHPSRFDSTDIDHVFDRPEEGGEGRAEPVRAVRAVSSHDPQSSGIVPRRSASRTRLTWALVSVAAILAAGVVGLLVTTFVMRLV